MILLFCLNILYYFQKGGVGDEKKDVLRHPTLCICCCILWAMPAAAEKLQVEWEGTAYVVDTEQQTLSDGKNTYQYQLDLKNDGYDLVITYPTRLPGIGPKPTMAVSVGGATITTIQELHTPQEKLFKISWQRLVSPSLPTSDWKKLVAFLGTSSYRRDLLSSTPGYLVFGIRLALQRRRTF